MNVEEASMTTMTIVEKHANQRGEEPPCANRGQPSITSDEKAEAQKKRQQPKDLRDDV
jgi:hypothetical protein